MFERTSDSVEFVDPGVVPVDGRTIRAPHLAFLWKLFGFTPPHVPDGLHIGVLEDLANNRNEVAHGRSDPISVGRRKTTQDVLRMLERVEEICIFVHIACETYLSSGGFRRV